MNDPPPEGHNVDERAGGGGAAQAAQPQQKLAPAQPHAVLGKGRREGGAFTVGGSSPRHHACRAQPGGAGDAAGVPAGGQKGREQIGTQRQAQRGAQGWVGVPSVGEAGAREEILQAVMPAVRIHLRHARHAQALGHLPHRYFGALCPRQRARRRGRGRRATCTHCRWPAWGRTDTRPLQLETLQFSSDGVFGGRARRWPVPAALLTDRPVEWRAAQC
mmetsp:Transcript_5026/g.16601  ORF Transcript_5026/g.16601 Transcript_5026/m.16601 type:complete len:218 (-) Transcript_5026:38-691(-)|eukprot:scaffold4184_cov120-Isochrysis_galbana.AAC.2